MKKSFYQLFVSIDCCTISFVKNTFEKYFSFILNTFAVNKLFKKIVFIDRLSNHNIKHFLYKYSTQSKLKSHKTFLQKKLRTFWINLIRYNF